MAPKLSHLDAGTILGTVDVTSMLSSVSHAPRYWLHPPLKMFMLVCGGVWPSTWACRSVLTFGSLRPPPCRPQAAAPRSHCYFFLSSISLVLPKAVLQKPLTLPCLSFPSLPSSQPWFPNSFYNDSQLEWLEIPTSSIQIPEDLKG